MRATQPPTAVAAVHGAVAQQEGAPLHTAQRLMAANKDGNHGKMRIFGFALQRTPWHNNLVLDQGCTDDKKFRGVQLRTRHYLIKSPSEVSWHAFRHQKRVYIIICMVWSLGSMALVGDIWGLEIDGSEHSYRISTRTRALWVGGLFHARGNSKALLFPGAVNPCARQLFTFEIHTSGTIISRYPPFFELHTLLVSE